ncbi:hypothetical protein Tco_0799020 [Tanacetum coccineum]
MRQRFSDPLALLANTYNPPPSYINQQILYHSQPFEVYQPNQHYQSNTPITQQLIQSPPLQIYSPIFVQQPPTFQPSIEFFVPTLLPTYDPIASLNKAMIFLSSAYSSKYPPTNNQLQTSSSPRTQAIIQNDQVTVQNVQGRQSQAYPGSAGKNQATRARVVNTFGNTGANQPRVIRCYTFNDEEVVLNDKHHDILADNLEETDDCEELQLQATTNFKGDYVDAYDSNCDDEATENTIFMASLSPVGSINGDTVEPHYDSDILSEVPHYDTYHETDVLNLNV